MKEFAVIVLGLLAGNTPVISQPGDANSKVLSAYEKQIDSLQQRDADEKNDTSRIKELYLLSVNHQLTGSDSAYFFAQKAIDLAEKVRDPFFMTAGWGQLAHVYYTNRKYDDAAVCWQKALDIATAHKLYNEELYKYRIALNNNFFLEGNYNAAMKMSSEGLETASRIGNKERMAHFNNVIGYIHMKQKNFAEARRYYTLYLQQSREIKQKGLEAHALFNLGDLAIAEKKYTEGIQFLNQSLSVYQMIKTGLGIDPLEREAYISNKLAEAYKMMYDLRRAVRYSLIAVSLSGKTSCNKYDIASYYINTGDIYNRLQQPDSALFFLRHGLAIALEIRHREEQRDAYEQIAVAFASLQSFDSAYFYQQLFSGLKDSILNENNQKEILQREASLQMEQQRKLQMAELSRQHLWRNIIIGIALFIILIVIILYNRYRIRQKMEYQRQLNKQQNEMFNLTASVQEKERKRIAEDIHDSLGSVLSAAKLKLSSLEEDSALLTDGQREKYQTTLSLLDEASSELRNISHNIMPATLSKLGLLAALKNLVDKIPEHSGLKVQLEAHGFESRLDESTEISIYRIILELINNIVKHAAAGKATVQLIKYPDYINITVEDDGRGFDQKRVSEHAKGIGLGNIQSRVNYLSGTIDIDSSPGRGTTVIIEIPYAG